MDIDIKEKDIKKLLKSGHIVQLDYNKKKDEVKILKFKPQRVK